MAVIVDHDAYIAAASSGRCCGWVSSRVRSELAAPLSLRAGLASRPTQDLDRQPSLLLFYERNEDPTNAIDPAL
jgi:hypothetical protein